MCKTRSRAGVQAAQGSKHHLQPTATFAGRPTNVCPVIIYHSMVQQTRWRFLFSSQGAHPFTPEPSTPSVTSNAAVNAPLGSTTAAPPVGAGASAGYGPGLRPGCEAGPGAGAPAPPPASAKRRLEMTGGVLSTRKVDAAAGPAEPDTPALPSACTWKV